MGRVLTRIKFQFNAQILDGFFAITLPRVFRSSLQSVMALYTIFAWTAIVIAGGAYYWIYIRQAPFPTHLFGISSRSHSQESPAEGISAASSQKRKRKAGASKRRTAASQTNELFTGTSGMSADDSEDEVKSSQSVQDERAGLAENRALKGIPYHFLLLT